MVEGRKDTLTHMAFQRWVEVRNDLEGKKWRVNYKVQVDENGAAALALVSDSDGTAGCSVC